MTPPVSARLSMACWIVATPLACPSTVTQASQAQSSPPPPSGGQRRAAVGLRAGERDDAEPRVVVVDAERRRGVEVLDRGVGGARGEDPVVAGAEPAAAAGRERERDDDAVLEHDLRRRAGGTVIRPVAPGGVEVDELRAAAPLDDARLVPAAHAQVPRGRVGRVRRPQVAGSAPVKRDRPRGVVDRRPCVARPGFRLSS